MGVEIREEGLVHLGEHARISIAFEVDRVLDLVVRDRGLRGFELCERPLPVPYVKDYDAIPGNRPEDWGRQFDLTNWGLLSAHDAGRRMGGAVIAFTTAGLHLLEDRTDRAILWDLRVTPEARGRGIGTALFAAAESWAGARGASELIVETQNTNVGACRFYERRGCELVAIRRFAYPELPEEAQLLWRRDLRESEGRKP
jgi:GNAT superfamily N-acetyltransferase